MLDQGPQFFDHTLSARGCGAPGNLKRQIAFCYHDVLEDGAENHSGFPGPDAASYKLGMSLFEKHLQALSEVPGAERCLLTFDDGGSSGFSIIAPMLEAFGRRGCFFVPTDFINRPGFLTEDQIRELHARGHRIGSHSRSHSVHMSDGSYEAVYAEWQHSAELLAGLLGEPVAWASVPSGYYSRKTFKAAAAAGIEVLFTLEPVAGNRIVEGCNVRGRYMVRRHTRPATVQALARGNSAVSSVQWLGWNVKKFAKAVLGRAYPAVRRVYFMARHRSDSVRAE